MPSLWYTSAAVCTRNPMRAAPTLHDAGSSPACVTNRTQPQRRNGQTCSPRPNKSRGHSTECCTASPSPPAIRVANSTPSSKIWTDPTIRAKVALAFPDIYELGGSNLGLMLLYDLINQHSDLLAERVYCPWPDFETLMRRDGIPLFGLESRHPSSGLRCRWLFAALRTAIHQRPHHVGCSRVTAARHPTNLPPIHSSSPVARVVITLNQ